MSQLEKNKQLSRQFLQLVSEHKIHELCEMVTPGWRMHGGPPSLPEGPEGVKALFKTFGPIEQVWTIEDIIAAGDKVVVRATNTCVQDSFFGIPAKATRQSFSAMFIHHIVDGKIAETWRNANDLSRLLQLKARIMPAPEEKKAEPI